jgi:hypothetical protein
VTHTIKGSNLVARTKRPDDGKRLPYAGSNLTAHAKCTDDEITWCATLGLVYVDIRELTYLHSTRWLKR